MKTTLSGLFSILGRVNRFAITLLLAIALINTFAAEQNYTDSWGNQGLSLTRHDTKGIELNFSIQHFGFSDLEVNGETMKTIEFSESFLPNEEGSPNLPGLSKYIAIPDGAVPVLTIVSMRAERFSNMDIAPSPRIPLDTEDGPLFYAKNPAVYSKNEFYPAQPVSLNEFTKIRGVDVCMLSVQPYQYNPVTKELIVYRDIEISIRFEGGNGSFGEERYRNRWWDPILEDAIYNFSALPKVDYDKKAASSNRSTGYDYLIIVPNDPVFSQWADSIKKFRIEEGIYTGIVKLADIGTNVNAAMLETYINDAYNNWDTPPAAVLLLGDYGQPTANNTSITSPIWDNYCVSDNILADVNNDDMPDIVFARITAQNAAQLESMIGRFLKYERNPPTNPSFYANPITALGWQTERWFQICSETVGGFWKNSLGKTPVRINEIYEGNPGSTWSTAQNTATVVGVFGPNGLGYIPALPSELGDWSGGNASMINFALNAGSFMLMHRDHGMETGWGEPYYTNSSINSLTNTDLAFILSINCLTGKYNWSGESFAEKFHRHTYNSQPAGALGLIAASEISYSFVNDVYVWGLVDNMWPNFLPQYGTTPESRGVLPGFGNAAGKFFLKQSNWPYNTGNKEVTYNLFHMHGDAFLKVCTIVPNNITAIYNDTILEGETTFTITANPNALVCLTANGVILGTGLTTLINTIDISIPSQVAGTRIKVTITKPNANRYEGWVDVLPMITAAVAGEDATVCEGTVYQLSGQANNYTSLLWESNGTGIFSDPAILSPTYTPSTEDVAMGAVVLSLTASNPAVNDSTDYMTLSLQALPLVFAGTAADVCMDGVFSADAATVTNHTGLAWVTSGTGTFDDPASVNPVYTPGAEDLTAGSVNLTLSAWNESCSPVESMTTLTFNALPEPSVTGQHQLCITPAAVEYLAAPSANSCAWEIFGGSIATGQNNDTITVIWEAAGEGKLILTETSEFGCTQSTEFLVTVNPLPTPAIDGNELVCANSQQVVYTTPLVEGDTYAWAVSGGELVSEAAVNEAVINWGENGEGLLSLIQTNSVTTCTAATEFHVAINSPVITLGSDTTICVTHQIELGVEGTYASYNWSNGSTNSTIQITGLEQGINSTDYSLIVADENGCEGVSSIMVTVDECTGIDENSSTTGISVYPNPNKGDFTLEISNATPGKANISIVNATGEIVYVNNLILSQSSHQQTINLNSGSGVYFLKVETSTGTAIQKLVVK